MTLSQSLPTRPKLFVDSSTAGHRIAEFVGAGLAEVAEVTPSCASIADASRTFDLAVFVLGGLRDTGMLLRLGVFLGALGRERVVLVVPATGARDLPAELRDVTLATYAPRGDESDLDAFGPICATLKAHVRRLSTPAHPAASSVLPDRDAVQVARRMRRSLGTARSVRSGQKLRIADISLSGALLETFGEIPEHQLLDLDLVLDGGRSARVTAKVVRIQYPQWGRVGGVGVAFTHFAGDAREILSDFLEPIAS